MLSQVKVPASLVKELRASTGAPILTCRKALEEEDLDIPRAKEWLRLHGIKVAGNLMAKAVNAGKVAVCIDASGKSGAIVEVNSQTDFVIDMPEVTTILRSASESLVSDRKGFSGAVSEDEMSVYRDQLVQLMATVREKLVIRRAHRLEVENGCVAAYMHNGTNNVGEQVCMIELESAANVSALQDLGKRIAKHCVASSVNPPLYISREDVPQEAILEERSKISQEMENTGELEGKPEAICNKIIDGKLNKWYEGICLLEQMYLLAEMEKLTLKKPKVIDIVKSAERDLKSPIRILGFTKWSAGESLSRNE